jgi:hypothetical protein
MAIELIIMKDIICFNKYFGKKLRSLKVQTLLRIKFEKIEMAIPNEVLYINSFLNMPKKKIDVKKLTNIPLKPTIKNFNDCNRMIFI